MPKTPLNANTPSKTTIFIGSLLIFMLLTPILTLGIDYLALNSDNNPPFSKLKLDTCRNDGGTCTYQGLWYQITRWRKIDQKPHNQVTFWVFN